MSNSRRRAKMKAVHLLIKGIKPLKVFPSILKELDNYKQLVILKHNTPKTKKTKTVRKILARSIVQSRRLLGIKKDPNRRARYSPFTTFDSKEELWKYLKHQFEWGLIRAVATERWEDHERRSVFK